MPHLATCQGLCDGPCRRVSPLDGRRSCHSAPAVRPSLPGAQVSRVAALFVSQVFTQSKNDGAALARCPSAPASRRRSQCAVDTQGNGTPRPEPGPLRRPRCAGHSHKMLVVTSCPSLYYVIRLVRNVQWLLLGGFVMMVTSRILCVNSWRVGFRAGETEVPELAHDDLCQTLLFRFPP